MKSSLIISFLMIAGLVVGEGPHKAREEGGVQRVEIVGGGYYFRPDHVVVRVNVPVELTVRKEPGLVPHSIVLNAPEAGIDFHAPLHAEPQLIKFTPTRTGKFPFYCDKKMVLMESHREKGMAGVLEVVD